MFASLFSRFFHRFDDANLIADLFEADFDNWQTKYQWSYVIYSHEATDVTISIRDGEVISLMANRVNVPYTPAIAGRILARRAHQKKNDDHLRLKRCMDSIRKVLAKKPPLSVKDTADEVKEPYYDALCEAGMRYHDMQIKHGVSTNDPVLKFTEELLASCHNGLPIAKLNRWLGYIQAVLIGRGYTTVEIERDWTRPLFRPLDYPEE